jgi:hypothetical protein
MKKRRGTYGFLWGNLRATDHLEDSDISGKILKTHLQETGCEIMNWTNLVQDRE